MEINNWKQTLILTCTVPVQKMTVLGLAMEIKKARVALHWWDIKEVHEYVKSSQLDGSQESRFVVITEQGQYIADGDFDDMVATWDRYKEWVQTESKFIFN
jgi:hypothetical protein